MCVALKIQFWRLQIAVADSLYLLFEQLRILFRGIEPILAAMRFEFGLIQIASYLTGRNRLDDTAFDNFICLASVGSGQS